MKLARLFIALSTLVSLTVMGATSTVYADHGDTRGLGVLADEVDADFVVAARAEPMTVGVPGTIVVQLDVKGDYHWNPDYPAVFETVGAPKTLTLPKPALSQLAGDFKASSPTAVTIAIPALPTAALTAPVTVNGKFSVCSDRICLIKKATMTVQVTAK